MDKKEFQEKIEEVNEKIKNLEDEKLRMEGVKRYIIQQGIEEGIIDQRGQFIEEDNAPKEPIGVGQPKIEEDKDE
ncbi:MAG: hypothetical protein ACOCRO_06605 [Halanaerobiales bacterium]